MSWRPLPLNQRARLKTLRWARGVSWLSVAREGGAVNISGDMDHLLKCLHVLDVLIEQADINGVSPAERAIDEFLSVHDGAGAQSRALNALEWELITRQQKASNGPSAQFIGVLFSYVRKKMRGLKKTQ